MNKILHQKHCSLKYTVRFQYTGNQIVQKTVQKKSTEKAVYKVKLAIDDKKKL